jgi:hypothetical protein
MRRRAYSLKISKLKLSAQNERARWTEIQTRRKLQLSGVGGMRDAANPLFGARGVTPASARESAADEKRGA